MKPTLLLAALGLLSLLGGQAVQQDNPPSAFVNPAQAAFFDASGGGSTLAVEIHDTKGASIPLVDTAGVKWPAVVISIPASATVGLGWELTQTKPDGTHYLVGLGTSFQYSALVQLKTGSVTESNSGTWDSSLGGGNGISSTKAAPSANNLVSLANGAIYQIRQGDIVLALSPPTNAGFSEGSHSGTTTSQAASTSWATLTTYSGTALGFRRLGVHVANTGSADVWVGTTSGSCRWIVPAGSDRQIGIAGQATLYFATLTGSSTVYATEYGF